MIDAALVVQGGGTRGAFAAGVLDVLMEEGLSFTDVYGTSAGALTACNFISGDLGRSRYIVTELMGDRRFISVGHFLMTGNLFNFKYLFRVVPKKKSPFNEDAFFRSPVNFYAVSTCLEDGTVAYLPKTANRNKTYRCLASSASLPLFSKPVKIDGKKYLDGGQLAPFPYKKPLSENKEKIVIILTREFGFVQPTVKEKTARKALRKYRKYPEFVQSYIHSAEVFNRDMREVEELEKQGRVFVIRPDIPPTVGIAERDMKKLEELYEQGKEACRRRIAALRVYLDA
ncbi:MAG: patatin family protein [Bacilli bacterium]|nr:patatin family protein [Bacilli bacterium]